MSEFDDTDTDATGNRGRGERLQAVISVNGTITTKLLPASGEVTIGRLPTCEISINDASVSRRHATLRLAPLELIDEGSRNGTVVRGKPLPAGTAIPVSPGDAIQIGDAAILLRPATLSFERGTRNSSLDGLDFVSAVDIACTKAAQTNGRFAVVHLTATQGDAGAIEALLRASVRANDIVRADMTTGFDVLLGETAADGAALMVARIEDVLASQGIKTRSGVALYPDDGVLAEQLLALAYVRSERNPRAPSTQMDIVRDLIRQVAQGDLSVLITGETGAGKELCAEAIHRLSRRADGPFIKFNCSALVESLIESELFGHERGAFTGATTAHPGLLESGDRGTIFLDEIGELPLGVQAKLLRVLEERIVRRVGATTGKKIDVRFVFATNRDLLDEVDAGRFRRDLYYRINGVSIVIPPLRERRDEIPALARAFAIRARGGAPIVFGSDAMAALEQHTWPGNVRELRNAIERSVLLSSGGVVRRSHLVLSVPRDSAREISRDSAREIPRDSQVTMPTSAWPDEPPAEPPTRHSDSSLANEVAELERQRIMEALERYGGNQSQVARTLGMSRNTLIARMEQYGLRRPRKRDD